MKKKRYLGNENYRGLYWRDPTVNSCPKENRLEVRGPLVLYSTPEPAAFAPSKTALVPFLSPFRLLLCFVPIESKAKCIASMILGALAAMAQTKVKRLLAHSSIGHMHSPVSALRQTRVKYIADLGALAKTNPILAITFSITMFSYAGIPPLAGFCSKFYLFFAALGCGAYFLAPVGVVTSVIGRWAAGRLPRVSQFGGPKAVLRAPDT
ncbi:UNVERIFIED_CONTAM: NADH-ubiquinone oxidoreductase chain 2 [Sesamum latifolium]|uniref:NADH-ubiquinone oxidoreductase chain 2 n=1 Tax=Sesamum latifolium TaxID=2727402 RepID=A0AAW2SGL3_9LAMI